MALHSSSEPLLFLSFGLFFSFFSLFCQLLLFLNSLSSRKSNTTIIIVISILLSSNSINPFLILEFSCSVLLLESIFSDVPLVDCHGRELIFWTGVVALGHGLLTLLGVLIIARFLEVLLLIGLFLLFFFFLILHGVLKVFFDHRHGLLIFLWVSDGEVATGLSHLLLTAMRSMMLLLMMLLSLTSLVNIDSILHEMSDLSFGFSLQGVYLLFS